MCDPERPFSASVTHLQRRKQLGLWLLCPEAQVGMGSTLQREKALRRAAARPVEKLQELAGSALPSSPFPDREPCDCSVP